MNSKSLSIDIKAKIVFLLSTILLIVSILLKIMLPSNTENIENNQRLYNSIQNIQKLLDILISISITASSTQVYNILFSENKQVDEESCAYRKRLSGIGILKVYFQREGEYIDDLADEFKKAKDNHKTKENPIKMIGVSLESYFQDINTDDSTTLSNVIDAACKSAFFQVLLCAKKNNELNERLKFVNRILDKNNTFEKTNMGHYMATSIRNIKRMLDLEDYKDKRQNAYLERKTYNFSPYATNIFINDHIYYTPNIIQYKNYLRDGKSLEDPEKDIIDKEELSFRIDRNSRFGKKLENLFDDQWKYVRDKKTSAVKGRSVKSENK